MTSGHHRRGRIVVLGGGVVGMSTAMLLAQQGQRVTVLERDPDPVPESADGAWDAWNRPAVPQFRQAHYLHPGARHLLERHLPETATSLQQAGAVEFNVLTMMPTTVKDRTPRPGDDRFRGLTARRAVIEYAVARAAAPHVEIRRGCTVAALTGDSVRWSPPRVTGVRLTSGETIPAELVVDASGRASRLPTWLEGIGARGPTEVSAPSGFTYYTRYFRGSHLPMFPPDGLMSPVGALTILTLPADAGTWSTTLVISSEDKVLKDLRDPAVWSRVLAACPEHAHWQQGETITGVIVSAGASDRIRRFVIDGSPVATGVLAVGDSWAHTDPTYGRGITLGLMHAVATADVVAEHWGDPMALAHAHDEVTQAKLVPWHRNSVNISRARSAEVRSAIAGTPIVPADDPASTTNRAFSVAMKSDADLFRAYNEVASLQTLPQHVLTRPGLLERVRQVAEAHRQAPSAGPTRARLLELIASR